MKLSSAFLILGFLAAVQGLASAADAFITPDGKTVVTSIKTVSSIEGLAKIDVASGKVTALPLPANLAEVDSVARGADGEILFLADNAVWVLKEGQAARKVVATTPLKRATGLFVGTRKGPLLDWLFVSGAEDDKEGARDVFYARKPSTKKFVSIFCRRVEDAVSGAFTPDGRFFFVSSADVWEGDISAEAGSDEMLGTLVGARIAPLGYLNTDAANAGSMVVREVAPAGKWIYAGLHGHHMGAIVRAPMSAKPLYQKDEGGFSSVKASNAAMAQTLAKTEVIVEDIEDFYGLCATEVNGKPMLFYYTRPEDEKGAPLMLWNGSGAPKVIGHLPRAKE